MKSYQSFVAFSFALFLAILPLQTHAVAVLSTLNVGGGPLDFTTIGTTVYVSNVDNSFINAIDASGTVTSIPTDDDTLSITTIGGKLVVANASKPSVTILDPQNNYATTTVNIGVGATYVYATGTKILAVSSNTNKVVIVDTANGNATTTLTVGTSPAYVAFIGTKAYVSNTAGNTVSVIDLTNNTVTSTISMGSNYLQGIVAVGTKLYVAGGNFGRVIVIDTANANATSSILLGTNEPGGIANIGSKVYVSNFGSNSISVIDTANGNSTSSITVGSGPQAIKGSGSDIYVANYGDNSLSVIDTGNNNAVATVSVGNSPNDIAIVGTKAYVTNFNAGTVSVIDTNTVAATLTEVTPIPSSVSTNSAVYYFSASYPVGESEAVQIGGTCRSQAAVSEVSNGGTMNVTVSNLQPGVANTCTAYFVDGAGNQSNTLTFGPFVYNVPAAPSHSGVGISEGGHTHSLADLVAMGLISPATAAKFGIVTTVNPFNGESSNVTVVSSASSTSFVSPAHPIAPISAFTSDLKLGMTDVGVLELQAYLNAQGFIVAATGAGSAGNETQYFGNATKAALIKFQKAKGISPASGYFGPLTRAYIAAH